MAENDKDIKPVYSAPKDFVCSESFHLFWEGFKRQIDLFFFTISLASRVDEQAVTASRALILVAKDDKEKARYQKTIDDKGVFTIKRLGEYSRENSRNILLSSIDSFLWYFSAVIQAAIRKRPELLKSNETLRIEEILSFRKQSELIAYIIDKKINDLSYGGLREMEKYVRDRLGLDAFSDNDRREYMNVFIELRNIHVHNRGIVNRLFLSRVPMRREFRFKEGKAYYLDYAEIVMLSEAAVKTAMEMDSLVAEKFKLSRKKLSTWQKKNET